MILCATNLYPRPDQPQRGMFNAQLFRALAGICGVANYVFVPEWRPWLRRRIDGWCDPQDVPERLSTRYLPVFYLPVIGRNLSWKSYRSALGRAAETPGEYDSILATWLYPDGVAATHVAEKLGRPAWIKMHGTDRFHLDSPCRGQLILDACSKASGIICNCAYLADRASEAGVDRNKLHVVHNGVDTDLFHFREKNEACVALARQHEFDANERLVLFVGNLARIKGPDILLEAWAEGRGRARLVIIGEGQMRKKLQQRADRLGMIDSVTFLGDRPHDEIAFWMNAADCLCLPSRSEGMPNVVQEAMASGLPVVATDVGEVPAMIDESTGIVVPADGDDVAGRLAAALRESLDREWDREHMSGKANVCSWNDAARKIVGLMTDKEFFTRK